MKTESAALTKQLRWQLLDMFPKAPMKLISEAAKSGDLELAKGIIEGTIGVASPQEVVDSVEETCSSAVLAETAASAATESVEATSATSEDTSSSHSAACTETLEAISRLHQAMDLGGDVDVTAILREDGLTSNADAPEAVPAVSVQSGIRRTENGWEIKCEIDDARPCQSFRTPGYKFGETVLERVGTDNTAAFAAVCFEQMLQREQELEGEFCVFYHSYNAASLIYEVEAEIARYAFGLGDKFAPLPRVIQKHFTGVSIEDLRNSEGAKHADNLPCFRRLAICASPTLFAFESEAPPLDCFRHGYGIPAPLSELTRDLLCEATGLAKDSLTEYLTELGKLAQKFGLIDCFTGNSRDPNRLGGQMLQIFIHCSEVDQMVYNSLPYGVPIPTDSVEQWLAGKDSSHKVDGQVRILMRPEVFLDESRGRIYHYCGDWEFLGGSPDMEGSRAAFVQELRTILRPALETIRPADMRMRLLGESDASWDRRLKTERAALERTRRAAAEAKRSAQKNVKGCAGYTKKNVSAAAAGNKQKGKKH